MARLARIVIPGTPHHVTQRGNRREPVFFEDDDYLHYMKLLSEAAQKSATEVWAYCLMPNHVHLILVPSHEDGLRATLGDAHRRYSRHINARNKWTVHLWQGRFGSVAMNEDHLVRVAPGLERYGDFTGMLKSGEEEEMSQKIRKAETIGRPIGSADWLEGIEQQLGHTIRPAKRGPKVRLISKLSP